MTVSRDPDRIIRAFIDEGLTELPDRVYDAVRSDIDRTRQRVVIGPWRTPSMNSFAKVLIAAAAVVVVAIVGINLLPRTGGDVGGGPAPTPSPSASASPTASAQPSPSPVAFPGPGALEIGRHPLTRGGVTFSVELTKSGWNSEQDFFFNKDVAIGPEWASFLFWDPSPRGVYSDPCAHTTSPPAGPLAADLAAAVASIPGTDVVSPPSDVTVGGRPGKHVAITVPENAPCPAGDGGFYLWYGDLAQGETRFATRLGATYNVWIVDVAGTRLFIEAESMKGAKPAIGQEIQEIIDSIQFE